MSELKREFKLLDLMDVWNAQSDIPIPFTTALRPIAEAHQRNVRRVYLLAMFPPTVVNAVGAMEQIRATVKWRHKESVDSGAMSQEALFRAIEGEIQSDMNKRASLLSVGGDTNQRLQTEAIHGFRLLDDMLSTALDEGGDAWLSAQVTATWTAFEALAEELWEAALNLRPRKLAGLDGAKRAKGDADKTIPLWLLTKYDYDLSGSMGTILKSKYGFDSLEGIRDGYGDAFSDSAPEIMSLVNDKSLAALALVRNLIVHNGGKIDEPYLRRKSSLPPAAVGELGSILKLDGALVCGLITKPLQISGNLISEMDAWLARNSA